MIYMKKVSLLSFLIAFFWVSFPIKAVNDYAIWIPVFMKRADLEQSIKYVAENRPLKNPGKIYCKDHYIYVNELYKGVHVINNSNPSHPVQEGFIVIPGCVDMAVKENTLYVDNSVDLVAFDLTTRQVTQRIKEVLPEPPAPGYAVYYPVYDRPKDMILVAWKAKNETSDKE
jgi:hypothetical protein